MVSDIKGARSYIDQSTPRNALSEIQVVVVEVVFALLRAQLQELKKENYIRMVTDIKNAHSSNRSSRVLILAVALPVVLVQLVRSSSHSICSTFSSPPRTTFAWSPTSRVRVPILISLPLPHPHPQHNIITI